MSKSTLLLSCSIFALPFLASPVLPAATAADARVIESYGKVPLHFEPNQGQTQKDVRFLSRGAGYSVFLTDKEAVLVLAMPDAEREGRSQARPDTSAQGKSVALRMSLVGAARKPQASGIDERPGKANYFIDNNPAKWRTHIPTYAKVQYREVYPGIDLVYYGNQRQLEHDFVVAPGANPRRIVLDFQGAEKLEIDASGDLVLHTAAGMVRQRKPVIYQDIDGARREIDGAYVFKSKNRVGFKLATYDRTRPLVIDPVLAYSTYLGGSRGEGGSGIAVDAAGNAYVSGTTYSIDFPTTAGAVRTAFGGGIQSDAFVAKLDPAGSALVYSTYLGGSDYDAGAGITVDSSGNAYATGVTRSANFPITAGAFKPIIDSSGANDAFVTKLDPAGGLIYSTYLGGSGEDSGSGIAVDVDRNVYVTGFGAPDFPTTPGAFQMTTGAGVSAAFVAKLDPAGSSLVYSSFFPGANISGIAVDAGGSAYLTGVAFNGFQTSTGAFQPVPRGGNPRESGGCSAGDAFITKFDTTGSTLVYSTYLGGSGNDCGGGIAVDAAGNAYVTGATTSMDFPTTLGAFQIAHQPTLSPSTDAYVTKLNPDGSVLVYSTYLGGMDRDSGIGIAVDAVGNAYVTGSTQSVNFPTTLGAPQTIQPGGFDAFVTKLNPTGSALVYSTYLGGGNYDASSAIAIDGNGAAYVTGITASTDFPTTSGAFQRTLNPQFLGGCCLGVDLGDAFVAKIVEGPLPGAPAVPRAVVPPPPAPF